MQHCSEVYDDDDLMDYRTEPTRKMLRYEAQKNWSPEEKAKAYFTNMIEDAAEDEKELEKLNGLNLIIEHRKEIIQKYFIEKGNLI